MSNQHDNIYNILGKLDALTPKQAPVDTVPAKTINESVEARGSVLAGVARVEARLAQQFAEANDWNNLGAEFRTAKPGTREPTHTGEKEYTKTGVRHHASKRYGGERSDDAETTSSTGEKRGRGRPKKSQFEGEEPWHGIHDPELLQDLIADAQAMDYDDFHDTHSSLLNDTHEFWENYHDGVAEGVDDDDNDDDYDAYYQGYAGEEPDAEIVTTPQGNKFEWHYAGGESDVTFAYPGGKSTVAYDNTARAFDLENVRTDDGVVRDVVKSYMQQHGKWLEKDEDAIGELIDQIISMKKQGMAEGQLNELSPELLKRARDAAGMKYAQADDRRDQKASDKYNRLDDKFNSALRKKQKGMEEGADEEEKGRIKDKYLPKKGVAESINFAEMMKEQHQTVDEYLAELNADIASFKKSGHMSDKLRDSLEMHKFSKKQLTDAAKQPELASAPTATAVVAPAPKPQGVMGRVGSAIAGGVKSAAGAVNRVVGHPSDAEMLDKLKRDTMKEELDELARLAGLSESLKGGQKKLDKNKNGKLDSEDFKMLRDKVSEATVDEDMIKAKKDDDKKDDKDMEEGNEFSGALDAARDAGKKEFEVDGKTYPVKEAKMPMKTVDGKKVPAFAADGKGKNDLEKEKVDECGPEMSPFSSMGHEEAESGMSINSSMDTKTGRRTLSVTADGEAAEELAQMLKMAGMGGHSHDEPKAVVIQAGPEEAVEEEREGQYANTPDEEVENIDTIMHQGTDLNREKEQYSTDRGRDNAMAIRREGIEMPKSLSRMLEAIKMVEAEKCNHTAKGKKCPVHGMKECSGMYEAAKPSAGMSKGEKSSLVKKAQAGGDIGKPGKSFDKVAKAAGGGEKGKRIAAAAMWKNAAK